MRLVSASDSEVISVQQPASIHLPSQFQRDSVTILQFIEWRYLKERCQLTFSPMPLNNIVRIHFQQIATNDSHNCSIFAPVFQKPACLSLISGYSMCIPT